MSRFCYGLTTHGHELIIYCTYNALSRIASIYSLLLHNIIPLDLTYSSCPIPTVYLYHSVDHLQFAITCLLVRSLNRGYRRPFSVLNLKLE